MTEKAQQEDQRTWCVRVCNVSETFKRAKESQANRQGVGWHLCSEAGIVDDNLFHQEQLHAAEFTPLDGQCQLVW